MKCRLRHGKWLALPLGFFLLSLMAVILRASYYYSVPHFLRNAFDWFASPGQIAWWLLFGGVFNDYPDHITGYAFLVAVNVAFWMLAGLLVAATVKVIRALTYRER